VPAEFPTTIPTITSTLVDGVDAGDDTPGSLNVGPHATHHNKLAQELVALATEVGTSSTPKVVRTTGGAMTGDLSFDNAHGVVIGDARLSRSAAKTLNVDGLVKATGGLATITKAGVIADSDITATGVAAAMDGLLGVDTSANQLMFRSGGAWRTVGGGTTPSLVFTLASGSSAGATSVSFERVPTVGSLANGTWVLIGAGTATAELRTVTSLAGAVVGVGALTYAHSANDIVFAINQPFVTAQMWGCRGASTINDTVALQEAVIQATAAGMWLDGQGYQYYITEPWMLPQSHRIRHGSCRAGTAGFPGAFSPAEASGAMVMVYNGARLSFTANASTDTITTSSNHGVANDIRVVVQGSSLPGGLVSGRVYFGKSVTANTMQLALTAGGAAVDITSAGSGGTVYCEVYASNAKSDIQDWTFEGANVANLNGVMVSLQQQTDWYKVRVNNCPGYGIKVTGQQANWDDVEVINCGDSVIFDNMSFLYCRVLNCEQFSGSAIKGIGSGLISSTISGFHFESRDTPGVFVDFTTGPCGNCIFDNGSMSGFDTDNAAWVGFDLGAAGTLDCSYHIRNVAFPQGTPSAPSAIALRDNFNGKTIHVWNDTSGSSCNRGLTSVMAAGVPSSFVYLDDNSGFTMLGQGGREFRVGSQTNSLPWMLLKAGSTLTGPLLQARDTSSNPQFELTKDGWVKLANGPLVRAGSGSPEGAVTAPVGSLWLRSDGGTNTALYRKESGSGNTGWVAVAGTAANAVLDICLNGYGAFNTDWTNMPSAETIFLNTPRYQTQVDLTNFTQVRFVVFLNGTGSAGSKLRLEYWNGSVWGAVDGGTGTDIAIDSGSASVHTSGWVNLAAGAKADVIIAPFGLGGDGVADPSFGVIHAQFK
jgi:hypothetical protein